MEADLTVGWRKVANHNGLLDDHSFWHAQNDTVPREGFRQQVDGSRPEVWAGKIGKTLESGRMVEKNLVEWAKNHAFAREILTLGHYGCCVVRFRPVGEGKATEGESRSWGKPPSFVFAEGDLLRHSRPKGKNLRALDERGGIPDLHIGEVATAVLRPT